MTVFKQICAFFGQLVVATGYARTAAVGDAPRDAIADVQFGTTAAERRRVRLLRDPKYTAFAPADVQRLCEDPTADCCQRISART